MSDSVRAEKRVLHAAKETEFLRLKRSRLGVDDFDPLKVSTFTYTSGWLLASKGSIFEGIWKGTK